MNEEDIEIVAELKPSIAPPTVIVQHRPAGVLGVGCASSIHEAKTKALEMLQREYDRHKRQTSEAMDRLVQLSEEAGLYDVDNNHYPREGGVDE